MGRHGIYRGAGEKVKKQTSILDKSHVKANPRHLECPYCHQSNTIRGGQCREDRGGCRVWLPATWGECYIMMRFAPAMGFSTG